MIKDYAFSEMDIETSKKIITQYKQTLNLFSRIRNWSKDDLWCLYLDLNLLKGISNS
jgi:hypothetical protein